MSAIDETWVEKKLLSANSTQESVQSLSLWALNHKTQHEKIVAIWFKVLKKGTFLAMLHFLHFQHISVMHYYSSLYFIFII